MTFEFALHPLISYDQRFGLYELNKFRLPGPYRGSIAQAYVTNHSASTSDLYDWAIEEDPVSTPQAFTLESFAWGILYAVDRDDTQLVVSQLNEFVYIAKSLNWILRDDNGIVSANLNFIPGLPPSFNPKSVLTPTSRQEIAFNSFLGFAVITGIRFLQDVYPLNSVKLYGSRGDYQDSLRAALKALAYFCAYAISPITNWVAYDVEDGVYAYEKPSRKASYLTDLFLSEYLLFDADAQLYTLVLSLHDNLLRAEQTLNSTVFIDFVEADYVNFPTIYDPAAALSDPSVASLLEKCAVLSYAYFWSNFFRKTQLASSIYEKYKEASDEYKTFYDHELVAPTGCFLRHDFLVTWLFSIFNPLLPLESWQTTLLSTSSSNPSISDEHIISVGAYVPGPFKVSYLPFESRAQTIMALDRRLIFKDLDDPYRSYNEGLLPAVNAESLQELKRMWPFGYHWTGSQQEEDKSSVVGSLLYAESRVHTYNLIAENILSKGSSPSSALGEQLVDWANILATSLNLSSSVFIRQWLNSFLQVEESLENLLTDVFGYAPNDFSITLPDVPEFYVRETLEDPEQHTSYVRFTGAFSPEELDKELYYSLAFTPSNGFSVSDVDYLTSSALTLNQDLGFKKRRVAGLPQLYPRVSHFDVLTSFEESVANTVRVDDSLVISPEDYIPGMKNVWVRDKAVLIDPLDKYVANKNVAIPGRIVPFLQEAIKRTQAAGIITTIQTSYISE